VRHHPPGCPCGATRGHGGEARRGGKGARGRRHARHVRVGRGARDAYLEAGGAEGVGSRSLAPHVHVGARDADLEPGGAGGRRRRLRARLLDQEAQRHLLISLARHLQETQPPSHQAMPKSAQPMAARRPRYPAERCCVWLPPAAAARTPGARMGRSREAKAGAEEVQAGVAQAGVAQAGVAQARCGVGRCGARRCGAALCGQPGRADSMQPGLAPPPRASPPGGGRCDTCWG